MPNQRKRKSSCLGDLFALPFRFAFLIIKLPFMAIAAIVRLPVLVLRSALPTKNRRRDTFSKPRFSNPSTHKWATRQTNSARPIAMKKAMPRPSPVPLPRNAQSVLDYLYLELDPTQFEFEVARMLRAHGFVDVERVGGADDRGIDIKCRDGQGRLIVVQCKKYPPEKNGVGSKEIQNFLGVSTRYHRAYQGIFVTTSSFTKPAKEIAHGSQIRLIDGVELSKLYLPLMAAHQRQRETTIPNPIRSIPANTTVRAVKMATIAIFAIVGLGLVISGYELISGIGDPTATPQHIAAQPPTTSPTIVSAKVVATASTDVPTSIVTPSPASQPASLQPTQQSQNLPSGLGQSASLKSAAMLYGEPGVPDSVIAILSNDSTVSIIGKSIVDSNGETWWPVVDSKTERTGYLRDSALNYDSNPEGTQVVLSQDLADPAHSKGTFRETTHGQRAASTPSP